MDENLCTFSERLKAERNRLGWSQTELGEIANAAKRTVIDWEKGATSPNATQLMAMAAKGLNLNYVLTGCGASPQPTVAPRLTSEHRALLDNYDHCAPADQAAIRRLAATAAECGDQPVGNKRGKRSA